MIRSTENLLSTEVWAKWDQTVLNLQILMKLDHNDHLGVGIRIYTKDEYEPQGTEEQGQMGSNSSKSSDFGETWSF